jgi:2-keto-3-deoxy-L-rhamnonate aldolase RhmA
MIDASFKQRLRERPQIGCFVTFASPGLTEFTAHLGFDFTLLDSEHSAMDSGTISTRFSPPAAPTCISSGPAIWPS